MKLKLNNFLFFLENKLLGKSISSPLGAVGNAIVFLYPNLIIVSLQNSGILTMCGKKEESRYRIHVVLARFVLIKVLTLI